MKKAIAAMDTTEPIELEMKAFQLDPNAPRKSVGNMTDPSYASTDSRQMKQKSASTALLPWADRKD